MPFNPLFDKVKKPTNQIETISQSSLPRSPVSNDFMELAYCGEIPVFVDLRNNVVLPVRD